MNATIDTGTAARLRSLLLQMATHEDQLACDENAAAPYWEPTPLSVISHRGAAHVLRAQADQLLAAL